MRTLTSPPKLASLSRTPAQRPTGLQFRPVGETVMGGHGTSPPGFLNGKNSESEWPPYWALSKIFKMPLDPRKPPFVGGPPFWYYQFQQATLFGISSSTNLDYLVYQDGTLIGIRVQSERFHVYTSSSKHAYDVIQKIQLEASGVTVIDIYEEDILHDPSGQKVIITMKKAIGRIERLNPIVGGTAVRPSKQKVIG